jgi:Ca-activated chloride channel family protein
VAVLLLVIATPRSMRADDRGDGERLYQAGRFREAAAAFARAIERHGSVPELVYDLGLALLRAGRTEEAAQQLERAAVTTDPSLRYRAMFNLGLAQLQHGLSSPGASSSEELTAAVESYRRVLELNPDDADAKWNYELANRVRKQRGGDKSDSSSGGNSPNPMPKNSPSPPRPSGAMDAERADQLLNSAAREEREVQARRQREARAAEPPGEKDW